MLLFALLLNGCSRDIQLTYYTDVCTDWDLNQTEAELRVEDDGMDIVVTRMGVERPEGSKFQPQIQANGWKIQIIENWDVLDEVVGPDLCFGPTVVMEDPPSGDYTIQWFDRPGVITPVHQETISVGG